MVSERPASGLPSRLKMLVAQRDIVPTDQPAGEGQDAHEAAGQHLEQTFAESRADLDLEPCLLTHFAFQCGAMILARIGPPARQIPFAALVQIELRKAKWSPRPLR
jgi:hypothetical protein